MLANAFQAVVYHENERLGGNTPRPARIQPSPRPNWRKPVSFYEKLPSLSAPNLDRCARRAKRRRAGRRCHQTQGDQAGLQPLFQGTRHPIGQGSGPPRSSKRSKSSTTSASPNTSPTWGTSSPSTLKTLSTHSRSRSWRTPTLTLLRCRAGRSICTPARSLKLTTRRRSPA